MVRAPSTARDAAAGFSTSPACERRRSCLPSSEPGRRVKPGHGVALVERTFEEHAPRRIGRAKHQHVHSRPTTHECLLPAVITYVDSQRLARLATPGRNCRPHVVPLAFRHNSETDTIHVGGHNFARRKPCRDVGLAINYVRATQFAINEMPIHKSRAWLASITRH
jgi:hypothetical protein